MTLVVLYHTTQLYKLKQNSIIAYLTECCNQNQNMLRLFQDDDFFTIAIFLERNEKKYLYCFIGDNWVKEKITVLNKRHAFRSILASFAAFGLLTVAFYRTKMA